MPKPPPAFFKIKNWKKYQHYNPDNNPKMKSRRPIWIKLYNSLLDDPTLATLSLRDRFIYCALLLLASRLNNRIPYDIAYLRNAMHTREKIDLSPLFQKGFLLACPRRTVLAHGRTPSLAQIREEEEKKRKEGEETPIIQDSEAVRVGKNGTAAGEDPERRKLLAAQAELDRRKAALRH